MNRISNVLLGSLLNMDGSSIDVLTYTISEALGGMDKRSFTSLIDTYNKQMDHIKTRFSKSEDLWPNNQKFVLYFDSGSPFMKFIPKDRFDDYDNRLIDIRPFVRPEVLNILDNLGDMTKFVSNAIKFSFKMKTVRDNSLYFDYLQNDNLVEHLVFMFFGFICTRLVRSPESSIFDTHFVSDSWIDNFHDDLNDYQVISEIQDLDEHQTRQLLVRKGAYNLISNRK